jgi:putative transposase
VGRRPRQHFAGAIFHFIARGNNRQAIFLDDGDGASFEHFLKDGVERYGHRIHAFCWMTNHVHMAVQVAEVPLPKVAHNLLSRYARWFNWKHGRTGHLFERRYQAFLAQNDTAFQSLARYIHLNPVRAGIVERPDDHSWSSYASYVAAGRPGLSWLATDFLLSMFGETRCQAVASLRSFTESDAERSALQEDLLTPRGEDPPSGLLGVEFGGGLNGHRDTSVSPTLTVGEILEVVGALCEVPRTDLALDTQRRAVVRARSLCAWVVGRTPHLTLEELATALGRDASTLSRAASSVSRMLASEPDYRELCRNLERRLGETSP